MAQEDPSTGDEGDIPLFQRQAVQSEVNLGDEGLQQGDLIDPFLDEFLDSGVRVIVPQGTYEYDGTGLNGNWSTDTELVGDGMVTLDWSGHTPCDTDIEISSGRFLVKNFRLVGSIVEGLDSNDHKLSPRPESGATVRFENFNMPEGTRGQAESEAKAYYVPDAADGLIEWVDCECSWWGNNAWYASSGQEGGAAECKFIRCYGRNNNIATFRVGSGPWLIRDCVIVNDQEASSRITSGRKQRGVRMDEPGGPGEIVNLHITQIASNSPAIIVSDDGRGGEATAQDVYIRSEQGEPAIDLNGNYDLTGTNLHLTGGGNTSYEGVWSNVCEGSGCETPRTSPIGSDEAKEHATLDIVSTTMDNFEYEFEVVPQPHVDASARQHPDDFEANDAATPQADGSYVVSGRTGETFRDIWEFRGLIQNFKLTLGQMSWLRFEVNGEPVDDINGVVYPDAPAPEPPDEPSIREKADLAITSNSVDQRTSYVFEIDGDVTATYGFEDPDTTTTNGTTVVEGDVIGRFDGFDYTGCIQRFGWQGPSPTVYRGGNPVANSDVVECPPDPDPLIEWLRNHSIHLLVIASLFGGALLADRVGD